MTHGRSLVRVLQLLQQLQFLLWKILPEKPLSWPGIRRFRQQYDDQNAQYCRADRQFHRRARTRADSRLKGKRNESGWRPYDDFTITGRHTLGRVPQRSLSLWLSLLDTESFFHWYRSRIRCSISHNVVSCVLLSSSLSLSLVAFVSW